MASGGVASLGPVDTDPARPWFRVGAPDLTDLRAMRATGRRLTVAELLLYVEAELELCDGDTVLFDEPLFEIAELADALARWAADGTEPDDDFSFTPSSWEATGVVRIERADGGWTAGSCFASRPTAARPWADARHSIDVVVTDAHERTATSLLAAGWSLVETATSLAQAFGLHLDDTKELVVRLSGRTREVAQLHEELATARRRLGTGDLPGAVTG